MRTPLYAPLALLLAPLAAAADPDPASPAATAPADDPTPKERRDIEAFSSWCRAVMRSRGPSPTTPPCRPSFGPVVYEVPPASIGARAGLAGLRRTHFGELEAGDRIVGLNGNRVNGGEAWLEAFERMGVGSTVSLTVARGKATRELQVALGED